MPDGETYVRDVPVLRIGRARRAFDRPAALPRRPAAGVWAGLFAAAWLVAAAAIYGIFLAADAVLSFFPAA
ncbi:MAG: hypothetical protein AB7F67_03290 [Rhodospirillaceae bacterium]